MKFEEEFPSFVSSPDIWNNYKVRELVQKHCLDKQKVKEVINKFIELRKARIDQTNVLDFEEIKKELGLEK